MVIRIHDLVPGADTAQQGDVVFPVLHAAMAARAPFVVSFENVHSATSSFVNAAFVRLLKDYPFSAIKGQMRVVKSTRQINDMIRTRLERVALTEAA
jgi:hypothetical protein